MNTAQAIMSAPATSAGFSLDDLDSETAKQITFDVPFVTNDDGDAVTGFRIVGKNSPEYQTAANGVRIANIQRSAKRNKPMDTSTVEGAGTFARTIKGNDRTLALAVVVGWFGFLKAGEQMEFDSAVVDKLFNKYPQWIVQVTAALDEDANFMQG